MNPESTDWQSWAALAVVAMTAIVFAVRFLVRRAKSGANACGSDCGCAATKPKVKS